MNEWISVKDRLPDVDQLCLCIDKTNRMYVAEYKPQWYPYPLDWYHAFCCGSEPDDPEYWMPAPEPPNE